MKLRADENVGTVDVLPGDLQLAGPRHTPRYFAWLYSPQPLRVVLRVLYAIESEIGSCLRPGMDHRIAHARLEWWRDECQRYAGGNPVHPLTRALAAQCASPQHHDLLGLVDTATWDLAGATFETSAELSGYCQRWAAAMIHTAIDGGTCGRVSSTGAERLSRDSGAALREIELLADLAREARCGRLRVPLEQLERAALEPGVLAGPPWPGALGALLGARHRELRSMLAAGVAALDEEAQPPLRGLLVWAALARQQSRRAERALPDVMPLRRSSVIADAWSGWHVARRALKGRFRMSSEE